MPARADGAKRAPNKRQDPRHAETITLIMASLPGNKRHIIQQSGLARDTVYAAINEMHKSRTVRIAKWERHPVKGPAIPVYEVGDKADAINRLKRLTKKEISIRYLANLKGSDRHDQLKAKWRSRHWLRKAKAAPATWFSALGGGV